VKGWSSPCLPFPPPLVPTESPFFLFLWSGEFRSIFRLPGTAPVVPLAYPYSADEPNGAVFFPLHVGLATQRADCSFSTKRCFSPFILTFRNFSKRQFCSVVVISTYWAPFQNPHRCPPTDAAYPPPISKRGFDVPSSSACPLFSPR